MAQSVNKISIIGRVGRDPEVRETVNGSTVANTSIATTDGWGDNEKTNWHRVVAWGKVAELFQSYVKKGDLIYVGGRIDYGSYDKNGVTIPTAEIVVEDVTFLGSGKKQEEDSPFG